MKANFIGGKLKLKNQITNKSLSQVKKVMAKDIHIRKEKEILNEEITGHLNEDEENYIKSLEEEIKNSNKNNYDQRTEAEKLFEDRKTKKLPEKIKKHMTMSYKQRYENFNKTLSKLPEHYDIPKVGPG